MTRNPESGRVLRLMGGFVTAGGMRREIRDGELCSGELELPGKLRAPRPRKEVCGRSEGGGRGRASGGALWEKGSYG